MAYHSIPGSSGFHYLNSPFGDTTFTKVFVGGLAWETQSDTLRRHFQPYGDILEAVVITDKNTGRSKGYGFVSFLPFVDVLHLFFFFVSILQLLVNITSSASIVCFRVIVLVTILQDC
ncbi:hypothetical protein Bca52824_012844 [Brassica carinata]|uniref:RRM domain-containing protein n=1 Tax=Brassica carinata TaxID=52824 RepID=A0A8X7VY95_BRACI|nr:hypothetical protein Bca52824_012844 [Brassica carinata]